MQVMHHGLHRAAESFSKIIGNRVSVEMSSHLTKDDKHFSSTKSHHVEMLYVLTTQLIGSIHGKSFFILTNNEYKEVVKSMGDKYGDAIKEGFLLEIDNIISAAVISDLSNQLAIEVYGDVPKLSKIKSNELSDFIRSEIVGFSGSVIESKLFFADNASATPKFTWILDNKIIELIPTEKLVA